MNNPRPDGAPAQLTRKRPCVRLVGNNARQGYVGPRIDTLKLAGYFFLGPA
jgi:hypothetical protein